MTIITKPYKLKKIEKKILDYMDDKIKYEAIGDTEIILPNKGTVTRKEAILSYKKDICKVVAQISVFGVQVYMKGTDIKFTALNILSFILDFGVPTILCISDDNNIILVEWFNNIAPKELLQIRATFLKTRGFKDFSLDRLEDLAHKYLCKVRANDT